MRLSEHISRGNIKVPYYIFNITSAKACPSLKKGLCEVASICYARKAEIQYPTVEPYRDRQTVLWDNMSAHAFTMELVEIQSRARKMPKVLRFSEAGDFRDQSDADKMATIAEALSLYGWNVFGYTARTDLNLERLIATAHVNVSNDKRNWIKHGANRFRAVSEFSGDNLTCPGDCSKCSVCRKVRGKVIEVLKH